MGTNMFRRASDWLDAQRHECATSPVTYRRGDRVVELNATIGRTEFQQDDGYGIVVRSESRDYIVRASDLSLDGVPTLPEVGDRIEEIQCGETYVYEVLPIGASQQHWRFSDQFRQTIRIHTRQIGGAA
jgi:hypothetical protein